MSSDFTSENAGELARIAATVRLVAIDLDGTTLDQSRKLVPESAAAIRELASIGITIVLASGRIQPSLQPYADELGLIGPFVCANGAHVVGLDGRELSHDSLARPVVRQIIDYAAENKVHLNLYARDRLFFLAQSDWGETYRSRASSLKPEILPPEELLEQEITKLMLIAQPESIVAHQEQLARRLGRLPVQFTESEPEYLEFLAPGVNKGQALTTVAESLGIPMAQTAAIGDYLNDVEMLRVSGIGAAVGNAHEETKRAARIVVSSSDRAGVAEFLRWIRSSRRE